MTTAYTVIRLLTNSADQSVATVELTTTSRSAAFSKYYMPELSKHYSPDLSRAKELLAEAAELRQQVNQLRAKLKKT